MDSVVLIFMPSSGARDEFDSAIRKCIESAASGKMAQTQVPAKPVEVTDNDQMPLWTWFVSGPRT